MNEKPERKTAPAFKRRYREYRVYKSRAEQLCFQYNRISNVTAGQKPCVNYYITSALLLQGSMNKRKTPVGLTSGVSRINRDFFGLISENFF